MFELPRIHPAKPGQDMPYITIDFIDETGTKMIRNRGLSAAEIADCQCLGFALGCRQFTSHAAQSMN